MRLLIQLFWNFLLIGFFGIGSAYISIQQMAAAGAVFRPALAMPYAARPHGNQHGGLCRLRKRQPATGSRHGAAGGTDGHGSHGHRIVCSDVSHAAPVCRQRGQRHGPKHYGIAATGNGRHDDGFSDSAFQRGELWPSLLAQMGFRIKHLSVCCHPAGCALLPF